MVIGVKTRKIDADTHFNLTVDYKELRDLLPRRQVRQAEDMMWRDAERFVDPHGVRAAARQRPRAGEQARGSGADRPDPSRDPEARIKEIERLGFDMQVLITQTVLPSPLRPEAERPLWLRAALAQLYNNAAAKVQSQYPDRFIAMATVPWDDIEGSVRELERAQELGLRAVYIAGNWLDKNLDTDELYPFWEAVNALDIACIVHGVTQGCGGTILDHATGYPMVGTHRYHRLHIGTYLGFGLDYSVGCAALTLGGVLDEFPNLRFLFYEAGAGWLTYAMLGCDRSFFIEPQCSRTRTRPSELIRQHCFTAVESLEPVEQLVEVYGSENFFIGTDYPHPEYQFLPNSTTDILEKGKLSEDDKKRILGGNVARALKLL
jgi:predicted TIM-barrel fold metal-dependent hydrolase